MKKEISNTIQQAIIADKWQRETCLKLIKQFENDKSVLITIVHDSIIIKQLI